MGPNVEKLRKNEKDAMWVNSAILVKSAKMGCPPFFSKHTCLCLAMCLKQDCQLIQIAHLNPVTDFKPDLFKCGKL